ncbi:hypothetical protein LJC04_04775 [Ruminococcaceae bacterium OttesenSCG-928-O06]|nr:hypothetical protein [Ruminococcaceae bacterium OttesenSCG-928-O06]
MQAFFALLKVSFKSLLITTLNFGRGKKRQKTISGVGALVLLSVLMLFISASYSFSLAFAFAALGGLDVMLMLMIMMATLFPLAFVLFAGQSLVFSTKDVDLVLSLPVSAFSIMLARVLALYLEALLMCELLLLPAGVAYALAGGAAGFAIVPLLLLLGVFLALVPTTLSILFGSIVSLVVARLRFKNLLNILFSLLLVVGILALSFSFSFTMSAGMEQTLDIDGLRNSFAQGFPPLAWATQAAMGNWGLMAAVAALCLAPFLIITWVFSRFYKTMLTHLGSHYLRQDYKLKSMRSSGAFSALLRKEARRFFTTPAYVLNSGIGVLLTMVACGAAVLYRGRIAEFLDVIVQAEGAAFLQDYLAAILLAAILFFGSITTISSVSISLEGNCLWILKAAPVSTGTLFGAKAGLNTIVSGAAALVCIPLLGWAFSLPAAQVAAMLGVGLLFAPLIAMMGLYINLLFPRLDAENETIVIKQSASVLVHMVVSFLLLLAFGGLFALCRVLGLGFVAFGGIACLVLAGLNVLAAVLLRGSGARRFAAL